LLIVFLVFWLPLASLPPSTSAQEIGVPLEESPRVTLSCIGARASIEAHVHLVGGRGRPARYLPMPALTCDGEAAPWSEATTIWRAGSIWHVVIKVESGGGSLMCEAEGMQIPALVRCPVAAGEVVFAIEPETERPTETGHPEIPPGSPGLMGT